MSLKASFPIFTTELGTETETSAVLWNALESITCKEDGKIISDRTVHLSKAEVLINFKFSCSFVNFVC